MRKIFLLFTIWLPLIGAAQPAGYYATADGLNGQSLRVALMSIIRPHTVLTYTPGLWDAYFTTDKKPSGKLWDIYSDIPGGTPAYEYTLGTDQCSGSSPTAEHGCYNREHTWPQSKFGSASPMQTDLFIVYPTDYFVNNNRGDLPYGKVGTATKTFTNSSKIGNNTYTGAPAGNCYEPIDSFKGDIARTYFYVSTCYRNDSATFINWEAATQVNLKPWAVQMLLEWHHNDPVSKKERDRNNAVYALQLNRNPFIDHPEYADCIWGTGDCSHLGVGAVSGNSPGFSLYPNPANKSVTLAVGANVATTRYSVKIWSMRGENVYSHETANSKDQLTIPVSELCKGIYFVQLTTDGNTETQKLLID